MDEPTPEIRVGDRERREIDDRLRQAHADGVLTLLEYDERAAKCWAARTRAELDALVRDLPAPPREPEPAAVATGRGRSGTRRVGALGLVGAVAVAGLGLFGVARVMGADDGRSVFGSAVVRVAPDQDRAEVGVLFGSVRVVVPDDARVRTTGGVLFGSLNCEAACDGTGTRDVVVDTAGAFGSTAIVRQNEVGRADR
jgi:hypothetical protein